MSQRLADRLSAGRRRRFVGRDAELRMFEEALRSEEPPFHVLFVYGPGGIGKSSLLRQFVQRCLEQQVRAYTIDGRNIEALPHAFLAALALAMGLSHGESPIEAMLASGGRHVILIDTYELLSPLDNWLREEFLPQLPEQTLVTLAGRNPLSAVWRADPGWQSLVRVLPLPNLSPDESRLYLIQRGVPAAQFQAVLEFTHGHPLALSLVADTFAQRDLVAFRPEAAPDIIRTLIEQFVQKAPGPAHRAALEACAQVRLMSEPLLAAMLNLPDPHELFDWLRDLSFVESGELGLFPHDLAREALVTDLRWRHPDWHKELHRRARAFYVSRLESSDRAGQQRLLFDLVFLHRENPAVRPFFEWAEGGAILPDAMRVEDQPALLAMVASHEGEASARLAGYWCTQQPQSVLVFRDASQKVSGFMSLIALERVTAADLAQDPAVFATWCYLQENAPLRVGEKATLFRFWMGAESYQTVSPVQSLVFIQAVNHYLTTPGLAFTFFPCAEADFWDPVLTYADLSRLSAADFEIGGRRYGVYGHDWRSVTPAAWLTLLGEREVGAGVRPAAAPLPAGQVVMLGQTDFVAAVRAALRDYTRPDLLHDNALLRSRRVGERAGPGANATARSAALRSLIKEAAEQLSGSPKENKYYRAIHHTYIQPTATQEQAAELLDVPFSTYRRHLQSGVARIAEILWHAEVR